MNSDDHPISHVLLVICAWLGTVTLAQVQTGVAIASGLAVLVYTVLKTWYLLRDQREKGNA